LHFLNDGSYLSIYEEEVSGLGLNICGQEWDGCDSIGRWRDEASKESGRVGIKGNDVASP
jgi:hypothetical protein